MMIYLVLFFIAIIALAAILAFMTYAKMHAYEPMLESVRHKYIGKNNGYYSHGKDYSISVSNNALGQFKVEIVHGYNNSVYLDSVVFYDSSDSFHDSWIRTI